MKSVGIDGVEICMGDLKLDLPETFAPEQGEDPVGNSRKTSSCRGRYTEQLKRRLGELELANTNPRCYCMIPPPKRD